MQDTVTVCHSYDDECLFLDHLKAYGDNPEIYMRSLFWQEYPERVPAYVPETRLPFTPLFASPLSEPNE